MRPSIGTFKHIIILPNVHNDQTYWQDNDVLHTLQVSVSCKNQGVEMFQKLLANRFKAAVASMEPHDLEEKTRKPALNLLLLVQLAGT